MKHDKSKCPGPMPYDKIKTKPLYGSVEIKGKNGKWSMEVPVAQGKDMEADGIPVYWIKNTVPWTFSGNRYMIKIWGFLHRIATWPDRFYQNRLDK